MTVAVSHLEDCVLWRSNSMKVASYEGCLTYSKCPQPRIKREGLRRMGGKGNRKYNIDLPTHLEHRCGLTLLKLRKIISNFKK